MIASLDGVVGAVAADSLVLEVGGVGYRVFAAPGVLAAAEHDIEVREATPSEVKLAVTGYGGADKAQVATMVATILGLSEVPTPDDAADALAIAIWTAHRERAGERLNAGRLDRGAIAPQTPGENPYDRAVREALRRERRTSRVPGAIAKEPVR